MERRPWGFRNVPLLDPQTRTQILALYAQGHRQAAIAATLKLPVELVADVLDGRL